MESQSRQEENDTSKSLYKHYPRPDHMNTHVELFTKNSTTRNIVNEKYARSATSKYTLENRTIPVNMGTEALVAV